MSRRWKFGLAGFVVLTAAGLGVWALIEPADAAEPKIDGKKLAYSKDIAPILKASCVECHGEGKAKKNIRYTSYDNALKTVVAGKPDESKLYKSLIGSGAKQMPPKSSLKPEEIATIKAWIAAGAKGD